MTRQGASRARRRSPRPPHPRWHQQREELTAREYDPGLAPPAPNAWAASDDTAADLLTAIAAAGPADTSPPHITVVDGQVRAHCPLADGGMLQVVLTDEGVIFGAFHHDEHVGTRAMTADEWADTLP